MSRSKKIKIKPGLTLQQELFCQYYVKNEALRGNATLCYAEAYDYHLDTLSREQVWDKDHLILIEESEYNKAHNVCSTEGNRNLRKTNIQDRITDLLNEMLTDKEVDAQLAKVILQDSKMDSKVGGIREYNKLKKRVTDKIEVSGSLSLSQLFDKAKE